MGKKGNKMTRIILIGGYNEVHWIEFGLKTMAKFLRDKQHKMMICSTESDIHVPK